MHGVIHVAAMTDMWPRIVDCTYAADNFLTLSELTRLLAQNHTLVSSPANRRGHRLNTRRNTPAMASSTTTLAAQIDAIHNSRT